MGGKNGQYLWTDLGFGQDAAAYRVSHREFANTVIVRLEQFSRRPLVKHVNEIGEIVTRKLASSPLLKLSLQFRELSIEVSSIREGSELCESTTLRLGQVHRGTSSCSGGANGGPTNRRLPSQDETANRNGQPRSW